MSEKLLSLPYAPSRSFNWKFCCDESDCFNIPDAPILMDSVWLSIAQKNQVLCIPCVVRRLGRPLRISDLRDCPANAGIAYFTNTGEFPMKNNDPMNLNGCLVRDKLTQYTGRVSGVVVYLSGCVQALLVREVDKDGKLPEPAWFDIQRLEVLPGPVLTLDNSLTPGFDIPPPVR